MLLNTYQRNSVQTALRRLERNLQTMLSLMADHPQSGILTSSDDQLSHKQKEIIQQEIIYLEGCLNELSNTLGLIPSSFSVGQKIMALISSSMVELQDIYAKTLSRYGTVSPELSPVLDPALSELLVHLKEIERAVVNTDAK